MLILFISHGSAQLLILRVIQTHHRRNVFQSIENGTCENELVLFKFSNEELKKGSSHIEWVEENEFRIEGEMYDVVKKEFKEDTMYLYCLHDEKESVLYSGIVKIINKLFGEEKDNAGKLNTINNILSEFYTASELNNFYPEETSNNLPIKIFHLLDGDRLVDTPPPRS